MALLPRLLSTQMNESTWIELYFFALTVVSLVLPVGLYGYMMWKRVISRPTVFCFGVILIALSGVNLFLLQRLSALAARSPALWDNKIFNSELSMALYLLPVVFAGIGVNVISHILISHLGDAEKRFDQAQANNETL